MDDEKNFCFGRDNISGSAHNCVEKVIRFIKKNLEKKSIHKK